jgi:hypothetical protein
MTLYKESLIAKSYLNSTWGINFQFNFGLIYLCNLVKNTLIEMGLRTENVLNHAN